MLIQAVGGISEGDSLVEGIRIRLGRVSELFLEYSAVILKLTWVEVEKLSKVLGSSLAEKVMRLHDYPIVDGSTTLLGVRCPKLDVDVHGDHMTGWEDKGRFLSCASLSGSKALLSKKPWERS